MSALITAIALLCQVHAGSNSSSAYIVEDIAKTQNRCQERLIRCIIADEKKHTAESALLLCIANR